MFQLVDNCLHFEDVRLKARLLRELCHHLGLNRRFLFGVVFESGRLQLISALEDARQQLVLMFSQLRDALVDNTVSIQTANFVSCWI